MKEIKLPKIENLVHLEHLFYIRELTRHNTIGYITGLNRSILNRNIVSHIYKGKYNELEKGMCKRAYNKDGGFSIFRNNITKGICRNCLKNTLKELSRIK